MEFFGLFTKKSSTKEIARDRLKLVLTHDRARCSPQLLEMMRADILKVISNYVEIDESESDIQLTPSNNGEGGDVPMLYANIAIKSMRKRHT
ncbi:MAG: cell division topological specificity factor MinE [Clostridiales bacterium]|jgi:cell division topological specificity factor|nr:cell division topological specificity factor MinE [Clostridiales bacterium]